MKSMATKTALKSSPTQFATPSDYKSQLASICCFPLFFNNASALLLSLAMQCVEKIENLTEIVEGITTKYEPLHLRFDEHGRTPLSYAAQIGFLDGVKYFLKQYPNIAFQLNQDDSFPIHKACNGGNANVVEEFLRRSPDTTWLLNKKGQGILHIAAGTGKAKVVEYLLSYNGLDKLINRKDDDGNTPLHLATIAKHAKVVYAFTRDIRVNLMLQNRQGLTPLDLAEDYAGVPSLEERLTWLPLICANAPRSPQSRDDKELLSPDELQSHHTAISDRQDHKAYRDRMYTLLLMGSTVIATVTFAAGFTIPGSYTSSSDQRDQKQRMATLARYHGFQVFVLSDTIALYISIFSIVRFIWALLDDHKLSMMSLGFALARLTIALTMMSIAFMTGLFVVLHGVCDWLATALSIMGCTFLPMVLIVYAPFYFPWPSRKNKLARYIFRVMFKFMLLVCDYWGQLDYKSAT